MLKYTENIKDHVVSLTRCNLASFLSTEKLNITQEMTGNNTFIPRTLV